MGYVETNWGRPGARCETRQGNGGDFSVSRAFDNMFSHRISTHVKRSVMIAVICQINRFYTIDEWNCFES